MARFAIKLFVSALALGMFTLAASTAQADFTPVAGWDHQLFPSFLISSATIRLPEDAEPADDALLGDRQGVLGVKVQSPAEGTQVTVTISCEAIMEPSSITVTLDEADTEYAIFPRAKFNYAALAQNKQSMPVTITYQVEIDGEESDEQSATVTLRSINDCPYTLYDGEGNATDISYVFAAYVNEQHPFVDKVLRETLNGGIVDSFTGYQSKDEGEVYRQVYALWDTLSRRDVRYSNITTSVATSNAVSSQHVRLIDESINNSQANCVDGSVLMASLLRKIDIEPILVYVPGHCYLGFYLDHDCTKLVGLETTLIGASSDDCPREIKGAGEIVDEQQRQSDSWATFCAAVVIGNKDLAHNKAHFDAHNDANYQLVSIAKARRIGILPIAFDSSSEFTPSQDSGASENE